MRLSCSSVIAAAGLAILSAPAFSKDKVGEVTLAKTTITGDAGPLRVKAPVYRDERIRTSNSGLGELLFRDGTKFAVGWNSSVVIDDFVFSDSGSARKVTVKAAKGTFRWISGHSRSSAYAIATPAGTLGIRGTAFDFYVGPDGTTAVVLLSGAARFCGRNGCRNLTRRCDVVVATPRRGIINTPRRVSRNIFDTLGTNRALPFQSGKQRLSRGFNTGSSCLAMAAAPEPQPRPQPRSQTRPSPSDKASPPPAPGKPSPAPEKPSPAPEPPQKNRHPNNGKGNGGGDGAPGNGRNAANDGDGPVDGGWSNPGRGNRKGR